MTKIYGAILDKGEQFYTHMDKVFAPLNLKIEDYNWFITGHEVYNVDEEFWCKDYIWLSGEQLRKMFDQCPPSQFWVWGILSGFEKDVTLENVLSYPLPHPESEELWQLPLTCLHPLARHEMVAWDSTLTLVKSVQKEVVNSFREAFPLSEDLEEHIASYDL